ncbi:hypothetical protein [Paenibacillus larvae]|uniref:hypothetical protein n=1 Tax=Paenibacillus larvae TaxID=1464 RepID=UPI0028937267|nr:hypothetical protein [Paenibacillus larvae]
MEGKKDKREQAGKVRIRECAVYDAGDGVVCLRGMQAAMCKRNPVSRPTCQYRELSAREFLVYLQESESDNPID